MSAVETIPTRPPRPTQRPGMPKAEKGKEKKLSGYSLDLESVDFDESCGKEEDKSVRRRSMTMDSGRRHANKRSSAQQPQPHIIDSSKVSPKMSKNSSPKMDAATQEKPRLPALSLKPNRPPPPLFSRSASQPQIVKMGVSMANPDEEAVMLRRRPPSADSAVGRSRTPPIALHRLSSPIGSRESSPLPNVPEDESGLFRFSPSHDSQSLTPVSLQITPTSPPVTPTRPTGPLPQLLPRIRLSKATPISLQSPPIPPSPSSSKTQLLNHSTPPPQQQAAPNFSIPISESPSSIPEARPDSTSPPPRGVSPLGRPLPRSRSSTSPSLMMTDSEVREREEEEDGQGACLNRLSTSKGGSGSADSNLPSSSPPTANTTPAVPPRPFMPPRPFPPNSKSNKPKQPRRETAPSSALGRSRDHHREKSNREISKGGDSTSSSRPKRATRHHPSPRHPPRPSQDLPSQPTRDLANNSPMLTEKQTELPGAEAESDVFEDQRVTSQQPEGSQKSREQGRKKKLVSFRSHDSIVNDTALPRQDTVELQTPLVVKVEASSPTRSKKIMSSMKKGFHSLRIKKKPLVSPQNRRSSDPIAGGFITNDMVIIDENYPDPLPQGIIDPLVVQCVAYLNKESVLLEEGLFRVPGDLAVIRRLRQEFMHGNEVDLGQILDPHTVAGLLKLHFREQKSSLIPRGPPLTVIMEYVRSRDVEGVCGELGELDVIIMSTLSIVVEMLAKVTAHSSSNLMTAGTLATSSGPSLFPYLPPSSANQITKFLIDNCKEIFHPNSAPGKKDKLMEELGEEEEEGEGPGDES